MKILHIIPSIDLSGGGPSKSVSDLAFHQAKQGQQVSIITNASSNPYLKESPHPSLKLEFVNKTPFKKALNAILTKEKFEFITWSRHLANVRYMQWLKLLKIKNIPYIITPRGMLEPWAFKCGKMEKETGADALSKK